MQKIGDRIKICRNLTNKTALEFIELINERIINSQIKKIFDSVKYTRLEKHSKIPRFLDEKVGYPLFMNIIIDICNEFNIRVNKDWLVSNKGFPPSVILDKNNLTSMGIFYFSWLSLSDSYKNKHFKRDLIINFQTIMKSNCYIVSEEILYHLNDILEQKIIIKTHYDIYLGICYNITKEYIKINLIYDPIKEYETIYLKDIRYIGRIIYTHNMIDLDDSTYTLNFSNENQIINIIETIHKEIFKYCELLLPSITYQSIILLDEKHVVIYKDNNYSTWNYNSTDINLNDCVITKTSAYGNNINSILWNDISHSLKKSCAILGKQSKQNINNGISLVIKINNNFKLILNITSDKSINEKAFYSTYFVNENKIRTFIKDQLKQSQQSNPS